MAISAHTKTILESGLTSRPAATELVNAIDSAAVVADAEITVGDEAADARDVSVQLKGPDGNNLSSAAVVQIIVYDSTDGDTLSSGGSTGLAIDTNGIILATVVAKTVFLVKTNATGLVDFTYTDTGSDAAHLAVVFPGGTEVISEDALTTAA